MRREWDFQEGRSKVVPQTGKARHTGRPSEVAVADVKAKTNRHREVLQALQ